MKNYLTLFALSLITLSATAQTDVAEQLKNVKAQLEEQVQRNDYLKEALALREGIQELTVNDITIKLTRVFAKDGTIVVQGLVKYKGDGEQSLQFSDQDLVDPKGNLYKSFNAGPPNNPSGTFHMPQAVKDIDYGFVTTFENIAEKLPNISLLTIRLFGNGAAGIPFNFKGVQVQW